MRKVVRLGIPLVLAVTFLTAGSAHAAAPWQPIADATYKFGQAVSFNKAGTASGLLAPALLKKSPHTSIYTMLKLSAPPPRYTYMIRGYTATTAQVQMTFQYPTSSVVDVIGWTKTAGAWKVTSIGQPQG